MEGSVNPAMLPAPGCQQLCVGLLGGRGWGGNSCRGEAMPEGQLNSEHLTFAFRSLFIPLGHGTALSSAFSEAEPPYCGGHQLQVSAPGSRVAVDAQPCTRSGHWAPALHPQWGEPSHSPAAAGRHSGDHLQPRWH